MKARWILASGLVAAALLALVVGLALAQEPGADDDVLPQGEVNAAASLDDVIPIQGRLLDSSGNPINGTRRITMTLYDASTGGTALCTDSDNVTAVNGLFNAYMDTCTAQGLNGRQVWLGIRVGGDAEMTPRQAIYAVPYAWSLRPGAVISETSTGAILNVYNHGNGWGLDAYSKGHDAVHGRSDASNHAGVSGENTGGGIGVYGYTSSSENYAIVGIQMGYSTADQTGYWKPAGFFGGRNGVIGLSKTPDGDGVIGWSKAVTGDGAGVLGVGASPDGWAGRFYNSAGGGLRVHSSGSGVALSAEGTGVIRSTAKSYLWISGNALQKADSNDATRFAYDIYGGYKVFGGSTWATNKTVLVPITIFGQLYGQNVTVTGLDLYCLSSDDTTAVTLVRMRRQNGVNNGDQILSDTTDRCRGSAPQEVHWDLTQNNILSNQQGVLYLALQIKWGGENSYVQIGGVRLTLEHD